MQVSSLDMAATSHDGKLCGTATDGSEPQQEIHGSTSSTKAVVGSELEEGYCGHKSDAPKPVLNVPQEATYSLNRWLDQTPEEEPWCPISR